TSSLRPRAGASSPTTNNPTNSVSYIHNGASMVTGISKVTHDRGGLLISEKIDFLQKKRSMVEDVSALDLSALSFNRFRGVRHD
ncbi:MAG: hypothetical protein AAB517_00885, partial [Patescibacteria group bacterium]